MENRKKEQIRKEMELNELEKVNGGYYVPIKPDEYGDDEDSNHKDGGATGGW